MKRNFDEESGINRLAFEIIRCAMKDYKRALNRKRYNFDLSLLHTVEDCENFFRSEWFNILSGGLNGELIISKIRKEVADECAGKAHTN